MGVGGCGAVEYLLFECEVGLLWRRRILALSECLTARLLDCRVACLALCPSPGGAEGVELLVGEGRAPLLEVAGLAVFFLDSIEGTHDGSGECVERLSACPEERPGLVREGLVGHLE